jgi:hypothetical protein
MRQREALRSWRSGANRRHQEHRQTRYLARASGGCVFGDETQDGLSADYAPGAAILPTEL